MTECNDPNCPIHGHIKVRGTQIVGKVVSNKGKKTAIVEREYTKYVYKYERSLRKRSRIPAHNPECINAQVGDLVKIGETRRISKTKSFVIMEVLKKA